MSSSSMKWITPLVARTSLLEMMGFPLMVSMSPLQPTSSVVPCSVSTDSPATMASAHMADFRIWFFSRSGGRSTQAGQRGLRLALRILYSAALTFRRGRSTSRPGLSSPPACCPTRMSRGSEVGMSEFESQPSHLPAVRPEASHVAFQSQVEICGACISRAGGG